MTRNNLRKLHKEKLIKIIMSALNGSYKNEVLDPCMKKLIIGEGKEYFSEGDWKEAKLNEWEK